MSNVATTLTLATPIPGVWVFLFVLAVLFPIADYILYSRLKSTMQVYIWNIVALWALTIGCVRLIHNAGMSIADFGQRPGTFPRTLIAFGVLVLAIGGVVLLNKRQKKKSTPEQLNRAVGKVRKLLPVTGSERMLYVVVAFTAGFCEEFLYRGWLMTLVGNAFSSMWAGLIASSICFGIAHAYQGRTGILSTGVLGLVFSLIFIASGSLLPGQILHAVMDLNNGLAMGSVVSRDPEHA